MNDLIERIEAATEGSRELDAEIHEAVTTFPARRAGPGWLDENGLVVPDFPGWKLLPSYTASIDAAMTLVPDGFAFGCGSGTNDAEVEGWAWCGPDEGPFAFAATPALALCVAALLAHRSRYGEDIFGDGK